MLTSATCSTISVVAKTLKPYQGLKQGRRQQANDLTYCRKNPKTLSGIETSLRQRLENQLVVSSHKNPKTLSGIETP